MRIEVTEGSSHVWSWRLKKSAEETMAEGTKTFESDKQAVRSLSNLAEKLGCDIDIIPLPVPEEPASA